MADCHSSLRINYKQKGYNGALSVINVTAFNAGVIIIGMDCNTGVLSKH